MTGEPWITLRPVRSSDAATIAAWKADPLVRRMALGPEAGAPSVKDQLSDIRAAIASPDQTYLVIEAGPGRRPVGYIRLNWLDGARKVAWLRFVLGSDRGRGIATQALRLLLSGLFEAGLHRFEAETYEFNHASRRVLSKLGFRREGTRRLAHWDGTEWVDILVWGCLKDDFVAGAPASGAEPTGQR